MSGCFNSCGQHHLCDLGFYGMSRVKNGYAVPHFQVMLGGQWEAKCRLLWLAIGAVPSKRIPEVVDRFTARYVTERSQGETFHSFIKRIGKAECKKMVEDLMIVRHTTSRQSSIRTGAMRASTASVISVKANAPERSSVRPNSC